eukprot:TRINITY_DN152_c1_g1_i1.p4 TRINITY_DN152_c1_g1~~TRINITY_DN152_c1_g1_i1.p4  ORF type:complete len:128 (-),score=32.61 TRINITY_DN152_c1_g1_i1:50-433(-)
MKEKKKGRLTGKRDVAEKGELVNMRGMQLQIKKKRLAKKGWKEKSKADQKKKREIGEMKEKKKGRLTGKRDVAEKGELVNMRGMQLQIKKKRLAKKGWKEKSKADQKKKREIGEMKEKKKRKADGKT